MPTRYHGTESERRALNAFINLVRAAESLAARIHHNSSARAENLSVSQFGVLETLLHLGPLCQTEIGQKVLKSGGNITMILDNLQKRGLVLRKREGDDRRFIRVHLTNKGKNLIRKVFPSHVELIVREMKALSPAEQETLRDLARKVGKK